MASGTWAAVVGEAHTLERTQAPDPWRPGPSTGQEEKGYHPKVTFAAGLSSWQPLPWPSVQSWPPQGLGPPSEAALPHRPLLHCLAEFGSSVCSAKATAVQAGAVRIKCSEGLGTQETRKCVVLVRSKGQSLAVSRSSDPVGRERCLPHMKYSIVLLVNLYLF